MCISVLINDTMNEYVQCEMCVQVQNKHYECSVKNGVILMFFFSAPISVFHFIHFIRSNMSVKMNINAF